MKLDVKYHCAVVVVKLIAFSAELDHHFPLESDHPKDFSINRLNWSMDCGTRWSKWAGFLIQADILDPSRPFTLRQDIKFILRYMRWSV